MNFLEFFIWGSWLISLGGYMFNVLHFTGVQVGSIYGTMGVASIFTPALFGIVADRWMNAERVLGLCHIAGAACLLAEVVGEMIGISPGVAMDVDDHGGSLNGFWFTARRRDHVAELRDLDRQAVHHDAERADGWLQPDPCSVHPAYPFRMSTRDLARFGFLFLRDGRWDDRAKDTECIAWSRDLFKACAPFSTGAVYVNFLTQDEEDRVRMAYGANFDRLATIKKKYDPTNFFRLNQNIRPAS